MTKGRIAILRKPRLSNVQWVLVSLAVIVPLGIVLGLIAGRAVQPVAREDAIIASASDAAPQGADQAAPDQQAAGPGVQGMVLADPSATENQSATGTVAAANTDTTGSPADTPASAQQVGSADLASASPPAPAAVPHRRGQEPTSSQAPLPAVW